MFDSTYIVLDSQALKHNIQQLKSWYGNDVLFSSVVKGNAYGHGITEFVPMAIKAGVSHFSVFSATEAYEVKGIKTDKEFDLMIMGMIEGDAISWAIGNEVQFYIFDLKRLESTIKYAKKLKKKALIHLELETGMNRTGLDLRSFSKLIELIEANKNHLDVVGVCTHFAGAESISNYHRIKKQKDRFKRYTSKLTEAIGEVPIRHAACSAASLMYPTTRYDMVRIGILQYGFFPSQEVLISYLSKTKLNANPLKRVLSWKSIVMDVKHIKAGEFVGYGTSYLTNRPTKIATIPVGYSNGFTRSLSNHGRVLINGARINVVGMVNMNMMAVDVTGLDHVSKGDEVVFIGQQDDVEMSVASFSDYSHQVNYELLTRLPKDIERLII